MYDKEHLNENKYLVLPSLPPMQLDPPGSRSDLSCKKRQELSIPSREMKRNVRRLIAHFEEKD